MGARVDLGSLTRMTPAPGPTTADATGARRLAMLQQRIPIIDAQIAEMQDRKGIIEHEIQTLKGNN